VTFVKVLKQWGLGLIIKYSSFQNERDVEKKNTLAAQHSTGSSSCLYFILTIFIVCKSFFLPVLRLGQSQNLELKPHKKMRPCNNKYNYFFIIYDKLIKHIKKRKIKPIYLLNIKTRKKHEYKNNWKTLKNQMQ
jgi:hypothetical protein